ncbi:polysaccharide pyruvyl transferase family protein [Collinsella tanakaei]|nr:polysaccharide pyruvyl transferase family protein [Collinsella tanakaei]
MCILIINQGHTQNIGDVAINEAMVSVISGSLDIQTRSVPFSIGPDAAEGSFISRALAKVSNHSSAVYEALVSRAIKSVLDSDQFDAAIIGGGELLHGFHKPFASAFYLWTRELRRRGIPVCALGVSGDMPNSKWMKSRYKAALQRCSSVGVRDLQTLHYVKQEYGIESSYRAPDVVFSYGLSHELPERARSASDTDSIIMFTPADLQKKYLQYLGIDTQEEYLSYLTEALFQEVEARSAKKVLFASTDPSDYAIIDALFSRCSPRLEGLSVEAEVLPYGNLDTFLFELSNIDIVLSCRMHACILGLVCGCKFTVIPFKEKLQVFAMEYSSIPSIEGVALDARRSIVEAIDALRSAASKSNDE